MSAIESRLQPTKPDIAGPFYRPNAPWRTDLTVAEENGEHLVLCGAVRDADSGAPLPNAVVDVWQAGPPTGAGTAEYDNDGEEMKYRGRTRTDAEGMYRFDTIMPGNYPLGPGQPMRPKHIHFKVDAQGEKPLTTQMYFAGDPYNTQDPFYHPSLEVAVENRPDSCGNNHYTAVFDINLVRAMPSQRVETKASEQPLMHDPSLDHVLNPEFILPS